jgi:hypothetical protein
MSVYRLPTSPRFATLQQFRQFGKVHCDPPRFVAREPVRI